MKKLGILCLSLCAVLSIATAKEVYKADIKPLNTDKIGTQPNGQATFEVDGDKLTINIKMKGVPPNIEHWEHFHGFPDGKQANCAIQHESDRKHDGYIDLGDTEKNSGTTMVPFNDDPAKMNIPTNTYPKADAKGEYNYTKVVSLKELNKKFGETYKGKKIDLSKRVIYVHGVPTSHELPSSVESLGTIPAHTTLPIACGQIVKVK